MTDNRILMHIGTPRSRRLIPVSDHKVEGSQEVQFTPEGLIEYLTALRTVERYQKRFRAGRRYNYYNFNV